MLINSSRLRNDLYCVEWDVKLYYTIINSSANVPNTWPSHSNRLPKSQVCSGLMYVTPVPETVDAINSTDKNIRIRCGTDTRATPAVLDRLS